MELLQLNHLGCINVLSFELQVTISTEKFIFHIYDW